MNRLHRLLLHEATAVDQPVPGEADAAVPTEPVITEPEPAPDEADAQDQNAPDIYELYPDLASVDITSPCTLADYFATLCESQQTDQAAQDQADVVPALGDMDTPEEFA